MPRHQGPGRFYPRPHDPAFLPHGQHPPARGKDCAPAPPGPDPPEPPDENTDRRRLNARPRPAGSGTGSSARVIGRTSSITSPSASHTYS